MKPIAASRHAAGGTGFKMSSKYCRSRLDRVLKQPTAGVPGLHRIFAKRAVPVGTEHLQRLTHNVPAKDTAVFIALQLYGYVANCVSWRRMKHKSISDRALAIDNFRPPTLDHGQN
jgi:hypothetical protein